VQLADPGPTAFDLRFRLFQTPVRVHPLFWLIMGLLGLMPISQGATDVYVPIEGLKALKTDEDTGLTLYTKEGSYSVHQPGTKNILGDLLIWIGCVFLSILLHEFGHVLAFRVFGNDAHIVLFGFGGLAIPDGAPRYGWQRIIVAAAGPGAQFIIFGLLQLALWQGGWPANPIAVFVIGVLLHINLWWPLLNLLPIWPLDGGQITREACVYASRQSGVITSLWISLILSATLALNSLLGYMGRPFLPGLVEQVLGPGTLRKTLIQILGGGLFMGIFYAMFAYGSWQALQAEQASRRRPWDDDEYDDWRWRR
jgi:Zn-dependent protease